MRPSKTNEMCKKLTNVYSGRSLNHILQVPTTVLHVSTAEINLKSRLVFKLHSQTKTGANNGISLQMNTRRKGELYWTLFKLPA